jgi:hypothetical protein
LSCSFLLNGLSYKNSRAAVSCIRNSCVLVFTQQLSKRVISSNH